MINPYLRRPVGSDVVTIADKMVAVAAERAKIADEARVACLSYGVEELAAESIRIAIVSRKFACHDDAAQCNIYGHDGPGIFHNREGRNIRFDFRGVRVLQRSDHASHG